VLRDVSIKVPAGAVVGLLGPNGAGKTTTLRVASGLLKPKSGSVAIHGRNVTKLAPHQRVRNGLCLVPEGRGVFKTLSVRDNLRLQCTERFKSESVEAAYEAFPILRQRGSELAGNLSGGQQQMLAIARAYVSSPQIVLLDEVSMGLAPIVVDEIFRALKSLAQTGVALLIVEQYVQRVLEMADSVVLLAKGSVAYAGPAVNVNAEELTRSYLGAHPK
jgi:branched-chain amino acid transport system ATP-binding protein